MEYPTAQVAACLIYFGAHGGRFTPEGRPIKTDEDRLLCGRAFDCGSCPFLHQWLQEQIRQGFTPGWECVSCIHRATRYKDANEYETFITGYYHSGVADDPDHPGIVGCTHVLREDNLKTGQKAGEVCGYQSFLLQLVLRKRRGP